MDDKAQHQRAADTAAELEAYERGVADMRAAAIEACTTVANLRALPEFKMAMVVLAERLRTITPARPPATLTLPHAPPKAVLNGDMSIEGEYVCFQVTRNDGTKDRFLFAPKSAARTADGLVQMALNLDPKALSYLGADVESLLDLLVSKPKPN